MSNYPDDIRYYDHDPRSPFYDDSAEVAAETALENAAKGCPALFDQCERLGLEVTAEVETEADEDGPYTSTTYKVDGRNVEEDDFVKVAAALAKLDREHPDLADEIEAAFP